MRTDTRPDGPPGTVVSSKSTVSFLTGPDCTASTILRPWSGPSSNKNGGFALASTTALACGSRSTGLGMTASSSGRLATAVLPGIGDGSAPTAPPPSRSDRQAPAGLGLGAGELGGDALGLLQKRVEVLCLDQFVGLQVLEGPGAAHRQAGRGRRPGIGEIHDDEPVVLAKHQVVGLKLAARGLHRLGHDHDPVAWLLHGPGDGLTLEGEEHRILRHRRYSLPCEPLGSFRPLAGGYASNTGRTTH